MASWQRWRPYDNGAKSASAERDYEGFNPDGAMSLIHPTSPYGSRGIAASAKKAAVSMKVYRFHGKERSSSTSNASRLYSGTRRMERANQERSGDRRCEDEEFGRGSIEDKPTAPAVDDRSLVAKPFVAASQV